VGQGPEKGRRQGIQVGLGFPHHIAGDEFRSVLVHVDETVELPQHVIGNVPGGAGFPVEEKGNFRVAETDFLDEGAQVRNGLIRRFGGKELLVVDGQNKGGSPALLLGERGQIPVTGHPQDFQTFILNGFGQGPDTQSRGILGTEVFVDDEDGKTEFHRRLLKQTPRLAGRRKSKRFG